MAGLATAVVGDATITFLWMIASSLIGIGATTLAPNLPFVEPYGTFAVAMTILCVLLIAFEPLAGRLGGASFNPAANLTYLTAGVGDESSLKLASRMPAQILGAVAGASALVFLYPEVYHKIVLHGPTLQKGVTVMEGAIAEGLVSFLINLIVLWSVFTPPWKGLAGIFKQTSPLTATVALIAAAASYTGPAMNPVTAFGFAYLENRHQTYEHFLVYWATPLVGALLAAMVFRIFLKPYKLKVKTP